MNAARTYIGTVNSEYIRAVLSVFGCVKYSV